MSATRKPHVRVDQHELGGYVGMHDVATLGEVARVHDISDATARRHLDGLVAQRLLERTRSERGTIYRVPGAPFGREDLDRDLAGT